ncbi:hypothetical protein MTO96_018836 [Rhipicephalus appendiculatus]
MIKSMQSRLGSRSRIRCHRQQLQRRQSLPHRRRSRCVPSRSSDSDSSSSSGSWSTSMPEYGEGSLDTTSTTTSTTTLKTGGRGSKRRHSDTTYRGRRRGSSSSTDTGTETEPEGKLGTKFWLYTVLAVMLTLATASAIGMSLRAAEAATEEPPEYTLPKPVAATTAAPPPQCNCANGSATANPDLRPGLASSEPGRRRRRAKTESPDNSTASGGNASDVERLNDEDGEGATVPDDGVPQKKVAGKATRSLVAFKIGPGRRKNAGEPATQPTPAIPNHTGARKTSRPRARRGERYPTKKSRATLKKAARKKKNAVIATSRTSTPRSSKTVESFVKPDVEEAAEWERERPLVNEKRRSSNAAAKPGHVADTQEVGALNAAARNAVGAAALTTRPRRGAR